MEKFHTNQWKVGTEMNENYVLDTTLNLLDNQGISQAYDYLLNQKADFSSLSSQYYNFLYCLAAVNGNEDEALGYLEEAIVKEGMWYRPEVFEDSDLDSIRETDRYKNCVKLSNQRYEKVLDAVETALTWKEKTKDKLVLALHGNQQNLSHSQEMWSFLAEASYQVEYLQSKELDSYQLYRWNDEGNGGQQLSQAINSLPYKDYTETVLCGFSAGCNTILKGITENQVTCSKIVLQSPWIPIIEEKMDEIIKQLSNHSIEVLILCGENDKDCYPLSQRLYESLGAHKINVKAVFVEDLAHDVFEGYEDVVLEFLK